MTQAAEAGPLRRRTLHGRRQGPKLRPGRRRLLEELLPRIGFNVTPGVPIDTPCSCFPDEPRKMRGLAIRTPFRVCVGSYGAAILSRKDKNRSSPPRS